VLSLCTESESTKATTKRSGARGRTLQAEGTKAAGEAVIKSGEFGPVLTLTWQLRVKLHDCTCTVCEHCEDDLM